MRREDPNLLEPTFSLPPSPLRPAAPQIIEISDNRVKVAGAPAIARALRKCTKLQTLIMESCMLRDAGGLAITAAVKRECRGER